MQPLLTDTGPGSTKTGFPSPFMLQPLAYWSDLDDPNVSAWDGATRQLFRRGKGLDHAVIIHTLADHMVLQWWKGVSSLPNRWFNCVCRWFCFLALRSLPLLIGLVTGQKGRSR